MNTNMVTGEDVGSAQRTTGSVMWACAYLGLSGLSGIIELGEENARTHREIGVLASGVFEKVYFLDKKSGALFGEGFGRRVDALTTNVAPLDSSSLLVCVGRMPPSIIQSLLP